MLSLLRLEHKQKNSSNAFRILIFSFFRTPFGIKTIKTFIQSRSSLKNHTRFQTKMAKVYTRFPDQNGAKTLPDRATHAYIAYIRDSPPPVPTSPTQALAMYLIYNNVVRRALRFTVQCSPLSQVMIPFHLARVTNASMFSLAVYLVHQDKSTEQGFLYSD